jgi:hypothetical protein
MTSARVEIVLSPFPSPSKLFFREPRSHPLLCGFSVLNLVGLRTSLRNIPPPKVARRTLFYGLALAAGESVIALAVLNASQVPPLSESISTGTLTVAFAIAIAITLALTAILSFGRLKKYRYGEQGVYRGDKLLFDWRHVNKVSLSFKESSGSVILVARPTLPALLAGPLVERETYVSYGASLSFSLADGSSISIPTDLDKMSQDGVIEHIHDISKGSNPSIVFE